MPCATHRPKRAILITRVGSKKVRLVNTYACREVVLAVEGVSSIGIERHIAVFYLVYPIVARERPTEIAHKRLRSFELCQGCWVYGFVSQRAFVEPHIVYRGVGGFCSAPFAAGKSRDAVRAEVAIEVELSAQGIRVGIARTLRIVCPFWHVKR